MNSAVKEKIRTIVDDYIAAYPEEYALFCQWMKERNEDERTDWAEFDQMQTKDMLIRKLGHKPDTLQTMLYMRLDEDEFKWLIGDKDKRNVGPKWFFESFPAFQAKGTNPLKKLLTNTKK